MIVKVPRLVTNSALFNEWCEEFCAAVERAINVNVVAPLTMKATPAGTTISLSQAERCFARITGSNGDGSYAWNEVYAAASGAWTDMPNGRSGTVGAGGSNAAWEFGKNAMVPLSTVVPMERNKNTGEWRFRLGNCS